MPAMAKGGVGRSALHEVSKLAQRDAQHRQETETISADQLASAEVGPLLLLRCCLENRVRLHLHSSIRDCLSAIIDRSRIFTVVESNSERIILSEAERKNGKFAGPTSRLS
jgi:hypothetical protein